LIFCPTSTNFFPPGSEAKYAVPIIGETIFVPLSSALGFVKPGLWAVIELLEVKFFATFIFLSPS